MGVGSLTYNESKATGTKTSLKKSSRAASNFIALSISRRSIHQMLAISGCGVQFLKTVSKFSKRKRKSGVVMTVQVLHKTWN